MDRSVDGGIFVIGSGFWGLGWVRLLLWGISGPNMMKEERPWGLVLAMDGMAVRCMPQLSAA